MAQAAWYDPIGRLPLVGGLPLADSVPSDTTYRLYNSGGDLYWNGSTVGGGGGTSYFDRNGTTGIITPHTATDSLIVQGMSVGVGANLVVDAFGGYANTGFGRNTLTAVTTGFRNTGFGSETLAAVTTGQFNDAFGWWALPKNTIGTHNCALGTETLANFTGTGRTDSDQAVYNTAVGSKAMYYSGNAEGNTSVGAFAGYKLNGDYNVAVGYEALVNLGATGGDTDWTTGTKNIAIGFYAMAYTTSGGYNVGLGPNGLYHNTTGSSNVAIGNNALYTSTAYSGNVAIGDSALMSGDGFAGAVAIGQHAGRFNTASDRFYVNDRFRTNEAGDQTLSLLYGGFADTAAAQFLTVNGVLTPAQGISLPASMGITIADGAPSPTTAKLYNLGGVLYWAGSALSSPSLSWPVTVSNGGLLQTDTTAGHTFSLAGYNTSGTPAYNAVLTVTAAAGTPALTLPASIGLTIGDGAPTVTTNKLYQVGSALYFNGSTLGGSVSFPLAMPAGTVGAPSLTFASHTTTGFYLTSGLLPEIAIAGYSAATFDFGGLTLANVGDGTRLRFGTDVALSRGGAGVLLLGNGSNYTDYSGTLKLGGIIAGGDVAAATFHVGATAGASGGPFSVITSITILNGIVTAITGS